VDVTRLKATGNCVISSFAQPDEGKKAKEGGEEPEEEGEEPGDKEEALPGGREQRTSA
jgi:hypothetical protein